MGSDAAFLFDIPVELVVELGRTKMTFGELAELQEEDVIKLDSLAGQPLDIMAGERLFGRGEVVIEDERVALRITEIVGQSDSPVLAEAG